MAHDSRRQFAQAERVRTLGRRALHAFLSIARCRRQFAQAERVRTLSSRALHAFLSIAVCTRSGFVTSKCGCAP